jgi:Lar family restriction alleviation protein
MELKSCPFCGGDGSVSFDLKSEIIFGSCWGCGARGGVIKCLEGIPTDADFLDALEAWNRRENNG